ncbi:glutactin-like, partial [Condylostylus longicornis]|uniref:glutactin-like n=1 Tax=Condylostylus longicornis TaxID=2530218 RepID=UPI00244DBCCD
IAINISTLTIADQPIVELPGLGLIKGFMSHTAWTFRDFYKFLDISYAESPSGVNRFKPPIPIKPWNGTADATSDGIGCPSVYFLQLEESRLFTRNLTSILKLDLEDCLSLNIASPNITGKYPVLFYIHGEYLFEGTNLEGAPEYLLEKDIVVVTPQYRLGPFGFLSTKTDEIPGNVGVLDIILALQWVKHFISYFGGDPDRITIMGQVGGAAIANLLTFTPVIGRGLFHQVIYLAGSAVMPLFVTENPIKYAKDIASKAGCNTNFEDVHELNKCFTEFTVVELLIGFYEHVLENSNGILGDAGGMQFTIGGPSPILPKHPSILWAENNNISYPALGGAPKNAGSKILKAIFENDFNGQIPENFDSDDFIDIVINQIYGNDQSGILKTFVKNEFFTEDILKNGSFIALLPGLIDLAGTIAHKIPVLQAINRNAKHLPDKSYLYSFDYKGQFNRYSDFDNDFDLGTPFTAGVTLTDENIYMFPYPDHVEDLNIIDKEMAKKFIELWTSFIIDGKPATIDGIEWPPVQPKMNVKTKPGKENLGMPLSTHRLLLRNATVERINFRWVNGTTCNATSALAGFLGSQAGSNEGDGKDPAATQQRWPKCTLRDVMQPEIT